MRAAPLRDVPIGSFGAVMGLAGLGLTARSAASLFPGVFRAPAYFTELWVVLGVIAFAVLSILYVLKVVRHPAAVCEEFTNPAKIGFCGTLPVGMTLVAGGLAPYLPSIASFLWWASAALLVAFQVWALSRWVSGGIELAQVNAAWIIVIVGGIVVPGPGIALGHVDAARFLFGVSATAAPLMMALVLFRAIVGPALPAALRPTWFILLVPSSLIYANGLALFPDLSFLENLFYFGIVLAVALLVYARGFLRWPFTPAWWAFTFPLDALAYAAARYAQEHPAPLWKAIAGISLVLATAFVVTALWKTLRSAASRAA